MKNLSILIPARNEEFLARTIQDILEHREADTEVIVVLDGEWAKPAIPQNERVVVVYLPESIGQRAATNLACKLAKGKYVMKVDAHCSFDQGFDRKLIENMQDDWTVVPIMRNLWAFDWKCYKCGKRIYQDKGNICPNCGHKMKKKMVWIGKEKPQSTSYCFDSEPHFQYFNEHTKTEKYKEELKTGITETMSIQGSCFMMTREKYWELNICDEAMGSWGSQGIEVACKTWFSGGRVVVNHNTWYAHMFRTKSDTFGFPYPQSGKQVANAKKKAKELIKVKGDRDLDWLLNRFAPVKGW